jgi:hypothetical protein
MTTVAAPVTPVLKPGTQAFIDALTAAGGLDTATEIQPMRGAITRSDVAQRPALPT